MRRLLIPVLVLLTIVPPSAAQHGAKPAHPVVVTKATGEIAKLGLKQIKVGKLSCAIGAPVPQLGRFVISDPVTIRCLAGQLRAIKYAPLAASPTAKGTVLSTTTTAPTSGTNSVTSTSGSVVLIPANSSSSTSQRPSQSARGPIASFSSEGVTVGDVTCPFSPIVFQYLDGKLHVGDVVSLSCTTPGTSPGSISIVWSSLPTTTAG